jgi:hypothetical protein
MKFLNKAEIVLFYITIALTAIGLIGKIADIEIPVITYFSKEEFALIILFGIYLIYFGLFTYRHFTSVDNEDKPLDNFFAFVTNRLKKITGKDISYTPIMVAVIYDSTQGIEKYFQITSNVNNGSYVHFELFKCTKGNDSKDEQENLRTLLNQCQAVIIINSSALINNYNWAFIEISNWGNMSSQMPCLVIDNFECKDSTLYIPIEKNLSIQYNKIIWTDVVSNELIRIPILVERLLARTLQRSKLWRTQATRNRRYAINIFILFSCLSIVQYYYHKSKLNKVEKVLIESNEKLLSQITLMNDSILFEKKCTFNSYLKNCVEYFSEVLCNEKSITDRKLTLWIRYPKDSIPRQIGWSYNLYNKETLFSNTKNLITCAMLEKDVFTSYDNNSKKKLKWRQDTHEIYKTDNCSFDATNSHSIPNKILCYTNKIDTMFFSVCLSTEEVNTTLDSNLSCNFLKNISHSIITKYLENHK